MSKIESTVSSTQVDHSEALSGLETTSSKIRYLLSVGMKRGEVAKILNIRYQHVRNVEITPIKKQK